MLAHGAHADASNSGGQRPAHYASSKGHLQILQKLHEIGADFHAADKTGATPLHRAASTGRASLRAVDRKPSPGVVALLVMI